MTFRPVYGFLGSNEIMEITVVLTENNVWLRDPIFYTGRIHKAIVENMRVDTKNIPETKKVNKLYYY